MSNLGVRLIYSSSPQQTTISQARYDLTAAASAGYIVFAGGKTVLGTDWQIYSSVVDVHKVQSNSWDTTQLSIARASLAGGATGDIFLFAGGRDASGSCDTVDVLDISSGIVMWTTTVLSAPRQDLAGTAAGNKIIFAGGQNSGTYYDILDIYDTTTRNWISSSVALNDAVSNLSGAASNNVIMLAGGMINGVYSDQTTRFDAGIIVSTPTTTPSTAASTPNNATSTNTITTTIAESTFVNGPLNVVGQQPITFPGLIAQVFAS